MTDKKAAIFQSARQLFLNQGFKDTSIAQIAADAGIAVGSFYQYYQSKEDIFLKVYLKENEDLKTRLFRAINPADDPVTLVTKLLTLNMQEMTTNRILKEWYNKDLFRRLEKCFHQEGGVRSIEDMAQNGMRAMIGQWRASGILRTSLDDETLMAVFQAIPYIDLHKDEIGLQHFPQLMVTITALIMKGLTA